jgi:amino acid transporter
MSGILLIFSNRFDQLAGISVITTLIPYIFLCGTAWALDPIRNHRIVSAAGLVSTSAILLIYFIV